MVDTAIFSIFHRAPPPPPEPSKAEAVPAPAAEAAPPPPPAAALPPSPPVEAAPAPISDPTPAPAEPVAVPSPTPPPEPVEAAAIPTAPEPVPAEAAPVASAPVLSAVEPVPSPAEPVAAPERVTPLDAPVEPADASRVPVAELADTPQTEPMVEPAIEHHEAPHAEQPVDARAEPELPLVFEPDEDLEDAEGEFELEMELDPEPMPDEPLVLAQEDAPPEPAIVEPEEHPAWDGAEMADVPVDGDQLGLANPIVITLLARLANYPEVELDASETGIYRPHGFRVAPWSGFPYDQAEDGRTGVAAGTRILTSRGEMEVERLLPGDTALTLRAPALLPITWIGRSSATAAPILIEAGALGPNLPRRPLCLAPDQAVYVEPIPVPAGHLVNGTTIRSLDDTVVDLFHVDVGRAEILFAEGVALSSSDRNRVQAR